MLQLVFRFLNHVGRLGELFYPQTSSVSSKNGIEFIPSAYRTDTSLGHSHRAYIDGDGDGVTIATLINNKIAVWAYDSDGKIVKITHSHSISSNQTNEVASAGVNLWSGSDSTTTHSHTIDEVIHGSAISVFCDSRRF